METFVAVKNNFEILSMLTKDWPHMKDFEAEHDFLRSYIARLRSLCQQQALFFDKIYIVGTDMDYRGDREPNKVITYFLWQELQKNGGNIFSFVDPQDVASEWEDISSPTEDVLQALQELKDAKRSAKRWKIKKNTTLFTFDEAIDEVFKYGVERLYPIVDVLIRIHALKLQYLENAIATPLLAYGGYLQKLPHSRDHDIAQLVIHQLPLPDSHTRWEQIIEYRENPENRNALLGLRRWVRKLSTEDLSSAEIAEELEWLQSEFEAHMRLHKIKADTGTLEVMIKAPLEVLENLVTLKFSKLVDPLFAIKKRRISLMEAELNAPGREIAYLVKAKQTFEKK